MSLVAGAKAHVVAMHLARRASARAWQHRIVTCAMFALLVERPSLRLLACARGGPIGRPAGFRVAPLPFLVVPLTAARSSAGTHTRFTLIRPCKKTAAVARNRVRRCRPSSSSKPCRSSSRRPLRRWWSRSMLQMSHHSQLSTQEWLVRVPRRSSTWRTVCCVCRDRSRALPALPRHSSFRRRAVDGIVADCRSPSARMLRRRFCLYREAKIFCPCLASSAYSALSTLYRSSPCFGKSQAVHKARRWRQHGQREITSNNARIKTAGTIGRLQAATATPQQKRRECRLHCQQEQCW